MTLTVIIPNWNGVRHLPTCLDALRHQTAGDFEVIVVDNASRDESQELVRQEYPEVRLVALPSNRGFTGACNAGMRAARGDILVLLNNDTEPDANWLAEVAAAFERHPEAGIVASKIKLFDRRDTLHTAGDYFRLDGRPGNRGVWQVDQGQYDREEYVFSACGGAASYRRAMLDQIGLFDDDFFFSLEDADLAWRAQLSGWRCVFAPRAIVYHRLAATGGGPTASFYDGRNNILLLAKDYPGSLFQKYWPAVLGAQFKQTVEALRSWRGVAARARLRGQLAGLCGLPAALRKRRRIQASRRVSDDYLFSILARIDETL